MSDKKLNIKYRKKPVVVEAYQTDKEIIIHTLEGDMKANIGDYIITGVQGEQYPCKPDIFEQTYEMYVPNELNHSDVVKALEEWRKALQEDYKRLQLLDAPMDCFEESHVDNIRVLTNALDLITRLCSEKEELVGNIDKLKKFKAYFDDLYGCDLEVLGWHENGNSIAFDEFYDSATEEMEGEK